MQRYNMKPMVSDSGTPAIISVGVTATIDDDGFWCCHADVQSAIATKDAAIKLQEEKIKELQQELSDIAKACRHQPGETLIERVQDMQDVLDRNRAKQPAIDAAVKEAVEQATKELREELDTAHAAMQQLKEQLRVVELEKAKWITQVKAENCQQRNPNFLKPADKKTVVGVPPMEQATVPANAIEKHESDEQKAPEFNTHDALWRDYCRDKDKAFCSRDGVAVVPFINWLRSRGHLEAESPACDTIHDAPAVPGPRPLTTADLDVWIQRIRRLENWAMGETTGQAWKGIVADVQAGR